MGIKIETMDITTEVPVSIVEITGFATPPVVVVEAILVTPELLATAAAVPPPAMIANTQVTVGSRSATVETMTAVPAMAAKGMATESKALST